MVYKYSFIFSSVCIIKSCRKIHSKGVSVVNWFILEYRSLRKALEYEDGSSSAGQSVPIPRHSQARAKYVWEPFQPLKCENGSVESVWTVLECCCGSGQF